MVTGAYSAILVAMTRDDAKTAKAHCSSAQMASWRTCLRGAACFRRCMATPSQKRLTDCAALEPFANKSSAVQFWEKDNRLNLESEQAS
ncbi:hypothetical protein ACMFMF_009039 [Clarireedia jacksonii]